VSDEKLWDESLHAIFKSCITKRLFKYEALEISEVMGPFERKVLIHYSFFGPLWKQRIYKLQLLLGATLKAK